MVGIDKVLARQREKQGVAGGSTRFTQTLFVAAGHRYLFRRITGDSGPMLEISDQDDPRASFEVPLSGWRSFMKSFTDLVERGRAERREPLDPLDH